jgi:hypothetical protein
VDDLDAKRPRSLPQHLLGVVLRDHQDIRNRVGRPDRSRSTRPRAGHVGRLAQACAALGSNRKRLA